MGLFQKLINILFPPQCIGCARDGAHLCPSCTEKLYCGKRIRRHSHNVLSLFPYNRPLIKNALWQFKFHGVRDLSLPFGILLEKALREHEGRICNNSPILVVPVPSSRRSIFMRGYDHAALIAQALARVQPALYHHSGALLTRARKTKRQTTLSRRTDRIRNMHGTFRVRGHAEAIGARVIVVDDIITTGATMREAVRALEEAGAKEVYGISLAYQELPRRKGR